jgi:hypothetical protein
VTTSLSTSVRRITAAKQCARWTEVSMAEPASYWSPWLRSCGPTGGAEENGLFAVMGTNDLFAQHIAPLVREHRVLESIRHCNGTP